MYRSENRFIAGGCFQEWKEIEEQRLRNGSKACNTMQRQSVEKSRRDTNWGLHFETSSRKGMFDDGVLYQMSF